MMIEIEDDLSDDIRRGAARLNLSRNGYVNNLVRAGLLQEAIDMSGNKNLDFTVRLSSTYPVERYDEVERKLAEFGLLPDVMLSASEGVIRVTFSEKLSPEYFSMIIDPAIAKLEAILGKGCVAGADFEPA
jgi:hypothetical protein